jgi:uncharacterized protein YjdB
LLDQDGVQLTTAGSSVVSSDNAVALAVAEPGGFVIAGISAGAATITAVRGLDGADATLEVTVTDAPFKISLGSPIPR